MMPGEYYARFADGDDARWSSLRGASIKHSQYGRGTITEVKPRSGYIPLLKIEFDSDVEAKQFNADTFKNGKVIAIDLPAHLQREFDIWKTQEEEKMAALAQGRKEMQELADKYHVKVSKLITSGGPTNLSQIIVKIDGNEDLTSADLETLKSENLHNVIATFYYRRFRSGRDPWDLVKASSELRRANLSQKAIDITGDIASLSNDDQRALGALWTTRGGAFRDLKQMEEARKCGGNAISAAPKSFHAHNLMGAILYEEGEVVKGQEHFDQALKLGASDRSQEHEIKTAIKRAPAETKQVIVDFLIARDPVRFRWARAFVSDSR